MSGPPRWPALDKFSRPSGFALREERRTWTQRAVLIKTWPHGLRGRECAGRGGQRKQGGAGMPQRRRCGEIHWQG
eukprot:3134725-Lingulodinium_polyedra.AAC.1